MLVPDFASIGVGFSGIFGVGAGSSAELQWVLHGPEASIIPALSVSQSVGVGYSADATFNSGVARYTGNAALIDRDILNQSRANGGQPTCWGSAALSAGEK